MTKQRAMSLVLAGSLALCLVSTQTSIGGSTGRLAPISDARSPGGLDTNIPYVDAKPILEALPLELLPADLRAKTPAELELVWADWVSRHDAEIRARLEHGDEDSIVNFLFYGVTFTELPRVKGRDIGSLALKGQSAELVREPIIQGRIADMVAAIASPGTNERVQFVRTVIERRGITPAAATGRSDVRQYLEEITRRVLVENEARFREGTSLKLPNDVSAEHAEQIENLTYFRDRGLSSDTSMFIDFAVEQALDAMRSKGTLGTGSVRRAAIIGPGLDFTDKSDGYDFYPQQTLQPFAVIDSLIRLGLAEPDDLQIATFDLNPRVNQYLDAAHQRARVGEASVLHLPLAFSTDERWVPALVAFWERFGDMIGEETEAVPVPRGAGSVRLRAVRVRPAVLMSIVPRDLNVVLQRPDPLTDDERFDLVIATNILGYYSVFEQSLALTNLAAMLRPGAIFIANSDLLLVPPIPIARIGQTDVIYSEQPNSADRMVWYRRQ